MARRVVRGAAESAPMFLAGGGAAGELMRTIDWAATPVGPVGRWPSSLKTIVGTILNSRHPMFLWWGPDLVQFYNDAYLPSFGSIGKHPAAMGQRGAECWREIWPIIAPQIEDVMHRGRPSWHEDHLVPIVRNGRVEEVYWTYGYSPVFDDSGAVGGTLVVVTETTGRVLAERRLRSLRELAEQTALATDAASVFGQAAHLFSRVAADVPFALLYDVEPRSLAVRRVGTAGIGADAADLLDARFRAGLKYVREASELHELPPDAVVPHGSWPAPVTHIFVAPIVPSPGRPPGGFVLFGLSPRLSFDEAYREYLLHLCAHLAQAHARIEAFRLRAVVENERNNLLEQAPVATALLTGPEHVFTLANPLYLQLVGRTNILGMSYKEVFPELVGTPLTDILDRVYETGQPFVTNEMAVDLDRGTGSLEHRFVKFNLEPVRNASGDVYGMMVVVVDITTERQRANALTEIDRAKTAFFSNISHEFRTPLTLLLGPLRETLARVTDRTDHARLAMVHRNAVRLEKLVNTLLDFARIEAGRVRAQFERTDLSEITADLASSFRSACEQVGLRLTIACDPLPTPVYVDRDMWEKIVLNLLSNALKYTFEGSIGVSLRASESAAILSVADTGIGIPADQQSRVFERFHRVPEARSRTHEGTGIGLALVQELVRFHGGAVTLTSAPGNGSNFEVAVPLGSSHLPADQLVETPSRETQEATSYGREVLHPGADPATDGFPPDARPRIVPAPAVKDGSLPRVLLVDDNADMREYLINLLGHRYAIESVADGEAALAAVLRQAPDLVLTDVMMPNLDGMELLRRLRAEPGTRDLPVLLLTARAGEDARVEGLEQGADDYLVKPFSSRELLARISSLLELARMRAEAKRHREDMLAAERAARGEAERVNRLKDEFLATLSHELRTPLNTILGWAQFLSDSTFEHTEVVEGLSAIERNARNQAQLVDDLLDMSRIMFGKVRLEMQSVVLTDVLRLVVEAHAPAARAKGIRLSTRFDAGRPAVVADLERLRQVFSNLVGNAVKFTTSGGWIEVSVLLYGADVSVSVTDTGGGIDPEFLPHVFERFRQANATTARAHGGLGLGLSIVKQLVELHGGTVNASSAGVGRGATFTVTLPLSVERGQPVSPEGSREADPHGGLTGVRVLVVDDETDARDLLLRIFRGRSAHVATAGSAAEALALLRQERFDLLVSDIGMPDEDGYQLIRRVRALPPAEGGNTPAIALTAYARAEDRESALTAGFQRHVAKPVEPDALLTVCAAVLPLGS